MATDNDSAFIPLCLALVDAIRLQYEQQFSSMRKTFCHMYHELRKLVEAKPDWKDPDHGRKYQTAFLEFLQILAKALENNGKIESLDRMTVDSNWGHKDYAVYEGKNVLSMLMDKLLEIMSTFPGIEIKGRSCVDIFNSIITTLRKYDRKSVMRKFHPSLGFDPSLPLTIWQAPEKVLSLSYHPGVFRFSCACKDGEDDSKVKFALKRSDITSLVHATSTSNLLHMILEPSSSDRFLELKGSRGMDTQQNKVPDLTPQGLIYCGVNINEFIENIPPDERNSHMLDKRYGIFELHFDLPSSTRTRKYFKLGTKLYRKEFSQLLLVSQRPEDFWWLSGTKGNMYGTDVPFFQKLNETTLDESWEWVVQYCKVHEYWTHPEIIIPGNLKIPWDQVKIKMVQSHKCINNDRRQYCYDCDKNCPVSKIWAINKFARLICEKGAWTRVEELQKKYEIFDGPLYEYIRKSVENPVESPTKKMKNS